MAGLTLADMRTRIARELRRIDLTTQINEAINTAIAQYTNSRFRFSDIDPTTPPTFFTEPGRAIYSATDNPNIASVKRFDYMLLAINNDLYYIWPEPVLWAKLYNQIGPIMQGIPDCYAYEGDKIIFSPVPNQIWQVTMGMWRDVPAPATDDEQNNPWMNKAELLIRSRAKYEIAIHVTRNPTLAQAMSPDPPSENGGALGQTFRAWKILKGEAARATSVGNRIRPMNY